ncbi:MAG TPA: 3-oxoadipate enol-lactonase [Pilimelia sp.]|nr:3-oxoadipate enol-lactonase [Pilimelia sp.]
MTGDPVLPVHDLSGPEGAPVVVLGSSLGTNRGLWEPQLDALRRRFRVLRFDHRGHGGAPAPPGPYEIDDLGRDVLALLDHRGVAAASYCGLSLGGMVGMWLAAHAPARVNRLVLCCTTAWFPSPEPWLDRARRVRAAGTGSIAEPVVARWFTPAFAQAAPEVVRRHAAMLAATDDEAYAGCCEAIAAMDLRPLLAAITAPTLVLAAEQDLAIPPAHGRAIADAIPGARLRLLSGGAHLATVEAAEPVTEAILAHLTAPPTPGRR